MKKTSQRSLLCRQNVNRTEAEWVHFLDGYRKALIEFDMKKFGDDWHTAEDIVEEIFLNIVREPRITALRPQDSFRHVLINMCMQKHKSFTKPWRRRLAERLSVALCLTMRPQDDARREIAAGFLDSFLRTWPTRPATAAGRISTSPGRTCDGGGSFASAGRMPRSRRPRRKRGSTRRPLAARVARLTRMSSPR